MIEIDKTLSKTERDILSSLIGSKLLTVDAVLAAPPDMAWNTVRLHTSAGSVDVNCFLETIPINDVGDQDEFGIISITQVPSTILEKDDVSSETSVFTCDYTITGIDIINNQIKSFEGSEAFCSRSYTKTIIIHTDRGSIVLDHQIWFDEMLSIHIGEDAESYIRDESVDWQDDEDNQEVHFELISQRMSL